MSQGIGFSSLQPWRSTSDDRRSAALPFGSHPLLSFFPSPFPSQLPLPPGCALALMRHSRSDSWWLAACRNLVRSKQLPLSTTDSSEAPIIAAPMCSSLYQRRTGLQFPLLLTPSSTASDAPNSATIVVQSFLHHYCHRLKVPPSPPPTPSPPSTIGHLALLERAPSKIKIVLGVQSSERKEDIRNQAMNKFPGKTFEDANEKGKECLSSIEEEEKKEGTVEEEEEEEAVKDEE
ncbi:hypothetical protein MUK42_26830 [Musa troglodytarum]|uniref:Uncharacterized protein n=1 Tax=Musa troglodytarum TaxID=320322 RepID=A0A9E7K260_9LILI|nr:hypothetical protein MUK42_26830 [Musa troglodytarum]